MNEQQHGTLGCYNRGCRCATCLGAQRTRRRNYNRKTNYGLAPAIIDAMLVRQNNCCAICRAPFDLLAPVQFCIDHDHATGRVRGLLCVYCNPGLGYFKDNIDLLQRAVHYLEEARALTQHEP